MEKETQDEENDILQGLSETLRTELTVGAMRVHAHTCVHAYA